MITLPPWDNAYPSRERLRAECDAMRKSICEAILANLGENEVLGLYTHGSSTRRWDTPIDYVPELSDVDVHVLLREPQMLESDLERSLAVQENYEQRFARLMPDALHFPRPQIMVINRQLGIPEFMPGPPGTATTLFGEPYDNIRPQPDPAFVVEVDRRSLTDPLFVGWVRGLPSHVLDRPGKFLWTPVRDMAWRVAPTGPRALSILGAGFAEAWGGNRTHVHARLIERGESEFAAAYAEFYLAGWDLFRSGNTNPAHARRALLAGVRVILRGAELAADPGLDPQPPPVR